MTSDAHSALADDETIDSATKFEKTTNMVADTKAATSSPLDQQGPLPMGTEEMVRHLENTVAHLTEQLQTIHKCLDRHRQGVKQIHPAQPPPATRAGQPTPHGPSPTPTPLQRKNQREPPAPQSHPSRPRGQFHIGSPSRKGKAVMVDPKPETEHLQTARQKRQARQQQRSSEDLDDYLYYSDDPTSPKRVSA